MTSVLILADDLTGALDSGVQLAGQGVCTAVISGYSADCFADLTAEVLVINTESRHLDARIAGNKISGIVFAAHNKNIKRIYKKTDSVLRGNVGSELAAVVKAGGGRLYFVPAYPRAGRITVGGVHYLNGLPVDKTAFAKDPFSPVKTARLEEIFTGQDLDLELLSPQELAAAPIDSVKREDRARIIAVDARTDRDMKHIAAYLQRLSPDNIAGCAGLAYHLPHIWKISTGHIGHTYDLANMVVISGSVNPLTLAQINQARKRGFPVFTLTPEQKLNPEFYTTEAAREFILKVENICAENGRLIIEAVSSLDPENPVLDGNQAADDRQQVADNIARIAGMLIQNLPEAVFFLVGGDTLASTLRMMKQTVIYPLAELSTGVVLSRLGRISDGPLIISKSGGLGELDVFAEVNSSLEHLRHKERQEQ